MEEPTLWILNNLGSNPTLSSCWLHVFEQVPEPLGLVSSSVKWGLQYHQDVTTW